MFAAPFTRQLLPSLQQALDDEHIFEAHFKREDTLLKPLKKEVPLRREECNYCETSFESKIKLTNHIKKVHSQLKKEVCNYCDVSFESKVKLGHHIKKIHSIEKPFKCEFCEKSYAINSRLKEHVDRYDSPYRIFMLKPYSSFLSGIL